MTAQPVPQQLRLVLDPNVYISARISWNSQHSSPAADLVRLIQRQRIQVIASPKLIEELRDVLYRDRFRKMFSILDANQFIQIIEQFSDQYPDPALVRSDSLCRDPDDIYLVALTRYTDAHYLISRDRDLLDMDHPHLHVRSPEQILKMLTD